MYLFFVFPEGEFRSYFLKNDLFLIIFILHGNGEKMSQPDCSMPGCDNPPLGDFLTCEKHTQHRSHPPAHVRRKVEQDAGTNPYWAEQEAVQAATRAVEEKRRDEMQKRTCPYCHCVDLCICIVCRTCVKKKCRFDFPKKNDGICSDCVKKERQRERQERCQKAHEWGLTHQHYLHSFQDPEKMDKVIREKFFLLGSLAKMEAEMKEKDVQVKEMEVRIKCLKDQKGVIQAEYSRICCKVREIDKGIVYAGKKGSMGE